MRAIDLMASARCAVARLARFRQLTRSGSWSLRGTRARRAKTFAISLSLISSTSVALPLAAQTVNDMSFASDSERSLAHRPTASALTVGSRRWTSLPESRAASDVRSAESALLMRHDPTSPGRAPWWSPAASLLLPGSGQFALGQQRSVAYLVAEGYLVLQALNSQRDARDDRTEYRSIASDVARRPFSSTRPVGGWDYYELMEKHLESGVFSKSATGDVVPETDTLTYNGKSWRLARENNWPNPDVAPPVSSKEYKAALAFYVARAIPAEYRWSWRDAQLQQDLYKQNIASYNRNAQRALTLGGLVAANHLVSMIDAYVTVRVRRFGGVRVAGLQVDGVESSVRVVGDPADGRRVLRTALRLVPRRD